MQGENLIIDSIEKCKFFGKKIVIGPRLCFSEDNEPYACNCFGAVDIALGNAIPLHLRTKGWYKDFCYKILGKDESWVYRFRIGFNHGHILEIYNNKDVLIEDSTSKEAYKLAKSLGFFKT